MTNSIITTPNELRDLIHNEVKTQIEPLKEHFQPKEPTEYMARNELT